MRYETNLETGEVTEHEDAPATPETPPTVADQLATLDAANTLTQRNLRDFILLTTEALKLGQPVDLSQVRGVAMVAKVEAEAAALRALL